MKCVTYDYKSSFLFALNFDTFNLVKNLVLLHFLGSPFLYLNDICRWKDYQLTYLAMP
jgi:hypothetical protein